MLAVTGIRSKIVEEIAKIIPEKVVRIDDDVIPQVDRYLLCAGVIRPKRLTRQTTEELNETWFVNFVRPVQICEHILGSNPAARICVIGSDSGFKWSFDDAYAGAKVALHRYIETKVLRMPDQQLVGIAPSIIGDCQMTTSREDTDNLDRLMYTHPKERFLSAMEVAKLAYFLLYVDEGYLSNTVIHMNGRPKGS